jgi:hypothetical protein
VLSYDRTDVGTHRAEYFNDSDNTLGSIEQHVSSFDVDMFSVQERLFLCEGWLDV